MPCRFGILRSRLLISILSGAFFAGAESFAAEDLSVEVPALLREKCQECHGPMFRQGGLRLDDPQFAVEGGISRRAILGGAPANNELLRRVRSTDPSVRMPKNAPPLTPAEIQKIAAWVEAGSPWPSEAESEDASSRRREADYPPPSSWSQLLDRFEAVGILVRRHLAPLLIVLLVIGFTERYQQAHRRNAARALAAGLAAPTPRFPRLLRVSATHYLNLVLIFVLAGLVQETRGNPVWSLTGQTGSAPPVTNIVTQPANPTLAPKSIDTVSVYGMPPRPFRPRHPRQLAGTYYRGNCERNEGLYNGGNYQTARFHLSLCDEAGNPVRAGDEIPQGGLYVQLDMERSHGTADAFYSEQTISSIAITPEVFTREVRPPTQPITRFETVRKDWAWRARWRLGETPDQQAKAWNTTTYIYRGTNSADFEKAGKFLGEFHYAVVCDLVLDQGRITDQSDVWMGSLFLVPVLELPTNGKVPLDEWFDFRPIPEIVGENTTKDPKLLGLPPTGENPPAEISPDAKK